MSENSNMAGKTKSMVAGALKVPSSRLTWARRGRGARLNNWLRYNGSARNFTRMVSRHVSNVSAAVDSSGLKIEDGYRITGHIMDFQRLAYGMTSGDAKADGAVAGVRIQARYLEGHRIHPEQTGFKAPTPEHHKLFDVKAKRGRPTNESIKARVLADAVRITGIQDLEWGNASSSRSAFESNFLKSHTINDEDIMHSIKTYLAARGIAVSDSVTRLTVNGAPVMQISRILNAKPSIPELAPEPVVLSPEAGADVVRDSLDGRLARHVISGRKQRKASHPYTQVWFTPAVERALKNIRERHGLKSNADAFRVAVIKYGST